MLWGWRSQCLGPTGWDGFMAAHLSQWFPGGPRGVGSAGSLASWFLTQLPGSCPLGAGLCWLSSPCAAVPVCLPRGPFWCRQSSARAASPHSSILHRNTGGTEGTGVPHSTLPWLGHFLTAARAPGSSKIVPGVLKVALGLFQVHVQKARVGHSFQHRILYLTSSLKDS